MLAPAVIFRQKLKIQVKRELVAIEEDGEKAVLIKLNISSLESIGVILWTPLKVGM